MEVRPFPLPMERLFPKIVYAMSSGTPANNFRGTPERFSSSITAIALAEISWGLSGEGSHPVVFEAESEKYHLGFSQPQAAQFRSVILDHGKEILV